MKTEPHTKSRDLLTTDELTKLLKAPSALTDEFHTAAMLLTQYGLKSHEVRIIRRRQIILDEAWLWFELSGTNTEPRSAEG